MPSTFGPDPLQNYYQTVMADQASKNPQTQMVGAFAASEAPTLAGQETQFATLEQQMGDIPAGLKQQTDYSTLMATNQLTGLGINYAQQGLQNQATQQQYGLTQQQQQEQAQKNALQYSRALQGQVQGAASSGTLGTGGNVQAQQDIGQQAQWANQDLSRQEQMSAGDYARAEQNFALMGQANGLSAAEVKERLAYGIGQLGQGADPTALAAQAGNVLSGSVQGVGGTLANAGVLGGMGALAGLG